MKLSPSSSGIPQKIAIKKEKPKATLAQKPSMEGWNIPQIITGNEITAMAVKMKRITDFITFSILSAQI